MGVRNSDVFDVGWLDTKLLELARQRLRPLPVRSPRIGGLLSLGHVSDRVGHASVPQQPTLGVLDQIAIVDKIHRLANVGTRRPARNVASNPFTAIENIEPLDPRLGLGVARLAGHYAKGSEAQRGGDFGHGAFFDLPR